MPHHGLQALKPRAWLLVLLLCASAQAWAAKAIDFVFDDVDGKPVRLADFRGKWVLVNFWAPWCPLCWAEVPTLNKLHQRKDFVVIGIGLDYGPDVSAVTCSCTVETRDHAHVAALRRALRQAGFQLKPGRGVR